MELVDDDRSGPARLSRDGGTRRRRRVHGDGVDGEEPREEPGRRPRDLDADRVVRGETALERDPIGVDPPAVGVGVGLGFAHGHRRALGKELGAGECCGVGGRLGLAVLDVPGADVDGESDRPEEDRHAQRGQDDRLTGVRAEALDHSRRSFIVLLSFPEATTQPSRLIEYGYWVVTTTSLPAVVQLAESIDTSSFEVSRPPAAAMTAVFASSTVAPPTRTVIALRAPTREASVSVS